MKTRCTDSCSCWKSVIVNQPKEGSMYQVFRNKRVALKGELFSNYERARQALRSYIRMQIRKGKFVKSQFEGDCFWDEISRNPVNFTDMGFTIRKVA